jgi:predicted nucleic acid-binding protein
VRVLVDTNVLLRSAQHGHVQQPAAIKAVAAIKDAGHTACVVPQVLYELWVVLTRPPGENGLGEPPAKAHADILQLRQSMPVLPDMPQLLDRWLELVLEKELKGRRAHDARLVATMYVHGVSEILTFNDVHFTGFTGINAILPRES